MRVETRFRAADVFIDAPGGSEQVQLQSRRPADRHGERGQHGGDLGCYHRRTGTAAVAPQGDGGDGSLELRRPRSTHLLVRRHSLCMGCLADLCAAGGVATPSRTPVCSLLYAWHRHRTLVRLGDAGTLAGPARVAAAKTFVRRLFQSSSRRTTRAPSSSAFGSARCPAGLKRSAIDISMMSQRTGLPRASIMAIRSMLWPGG